MKKLLSCTKTAVVLLVATLLLAGAYVYMLVRPISYGMDYTVKTVYDGVPFEGRMKFNPNGTMTIVNSSYKEGINQYYYYKDGYAFILMAQDEEERDAEIAKIDEDLEAAVNTPFYASTMNAFKFVPLSVDGYVTEYVCTPAIIVAIAGGVVLLAFLGLSCVSLILCKKAKKEN